MFIENRLYPLLNPKMLHQCNIGYGCAIAISLVIVRVQMRLCYGFVFEKKAKSVTFY